MNTDLAAQRAMDRLAAGGFETLSETDRVLATVWLFAAEVGNSGFVAYFSGRRGDLAFFAPRALEAIAAPELASIAGQANALLGPKGPSREQEERREQVRRLPASARASLAQLEDRYFDTTEDVDALMDVYLSHASAR